MRVGVYVDGYNLYYGGRKHCGRGTAGWRWLDVRALVETLLAEKAVDWPSASLERIVYRTARISAAHNASGSQDQDVYLKALLAAGSVDHIGYGNYISKVVKRPLAVEKGGSGKSRHHPVLVAPTWPIMVQDGGAPVTDAVFMASVARFEEKGSDVNVAAHLLVDVLTSVVDAVIVISNDSDLRMPVHEAWNRVPVGLVNPGGGYTAGALSMNAGTGLGSGNHWWRTLNSGDYTGHQLPDPAGRYTRPPGW